MTFYLKPPRGMIDYHILQKCVEQRMHLFGNLVDIERLSARDINCVFEDSAYDRAGHFILRLAAYKSPSFAINFINSEATLLENRLESFDKRSVILFLKTLLRQSKECAAAEDHHENIVSFLNILTNVCKKMLTTSFRNHVFNSAHVEGSSCKYFMLNVPFKHCISLVPSYKFNLNRGFVQIPCKKWKLLYRSLFRTYLSLALQEMHYSKSVETALNDQRIVNILYSKVLTANIEFELPSKREISNIDTEIADFPLCMYHLHTSLKVNHRLSHDARFNLSLFLKDIGFSVHDSINYWKAEYSKEHSGCTKCLHNWRKDEKKYVYSIRHMYGLEGGRKSYCARSCHYFQNKIMSATEEGGCPLKAFDNEKLRVLLQSRLNQNPLAIENIMLERNANPQSACQLFHHAYRTSNQTKDKNKSGCSETVSFSNPVQYYLLMKKHDL